MNALLLAGTLLEPAYKFFNVQSDIELIYKMNYIGTLVIIISGLYCLFYSTPYGKFSKSWTGPTVNAKFAWMIQEIPAWTIPLILMYQSPCIYMNNTPNLLVILLFIFHYIQRTLVYPLRIKERAKPVPIVIIIFALIFCTFNGLFQSHHLLNVERIGNSNFLIPGVVLFILGMGINIHHDGILTSLKKQIKNSDGTKSEYQIPRGGLFEYVSGANYLGEILEWWGFAVASGKVPQLIFAIFSTVFLGIRAWQNHQYYKKTFGASYPHKRTAIIPFII